MPRAYTTFTLVPDAEPKLGGSFEGEKMTRRRFQRGSIYKRGKRKKVWVARFFEDVIAPDGAVKRIRRSEILGSITEIPTRRQAEQVLQDRLRLFNSSDYRPSSSCTLAGVCRESLVAGSAPYTQTLNQETLPVHVCECTFTRHSGGCNSGSLTATWCRDFISAKLRSGLSWRTVKGIRTAFGTVVTRPRLTGSVPVKNTIGIVEVAVFAAIAGEVSPTMTAACRCMSSAIKAGRCSS